MIFDVQKVFSSLPPGVMYEPPSAFVVSNRLLDELYDGQMKIVKARIARSSGAAASFDGRTNIHHEPMLDFSITIPYELPIYMKIIKTMVKFKMPNEWLLKLRQQSKKLVCTRLT